MLTKLLFEPDATRILTAGKAAADIHSNGLWNFEWSGR
jgi:hypothetical protein